MAKEVLLERLTNELSEVIERASQSIVLVQGRRLPSSGIVWNKNIIVTADHLLARGEQLHIRTSSGDEITATIAGRDPSTDVAFLKTTVELPTLEIDSNHSFKTGQFGITIGRASGGRLLAILTMISGSGEIYRNWRGGQLDQFIRLDIAPFPGFSGSAFVLPDGKIAGMNTSVFSKHFGLAVPASNIERLEQRLSAKGSIGKPYVGLMMQPIRLPEKMRQEAGSEIGLLVIGTEKGSPAEEAGVLIGDIIVKFNEKSVTSTEEMHEFLTEESIGKTVNLSLIRGGKLQQLQTKIGERPLHHRKG